MSFQALYQSTGKKIKMIIIELVLVKFHNMLRPVLRDLVDLRWKILQKGLGLNHSTMDVFPGDLKTTTLEKVNVSIWATAHLPLP